MKSMGKIGIVNTLVAASKGELRVAKRSTDIVMAFVKKDVE